MKRISLRTVALAAPFFGAAVINGCAPDDPTTVQPGGGTAGTGTPGGGMAGTGTPGGGMAGSVTPGGAAGSIQGGMAGTPTGGMAGTPTGGMAGTGGAPGGPT